MNWEWLGQGCKFPRWVLESGLLAVTGCEGAEGRPQAQVLLWALLARAGSVCTPACGHAQMHSWE